VERLPAEQILRSPVTSVSLGIGRPRQILNRTCDPLCVFPTLRTPLEDR
jgi:hypothetical protein